MLKVQDKPFTNIEDITKINMVTQNVVVCTSLPVGINLCGHSADCMGKSKTEILQTNLTVKGFSHQDSWALHGTENITTSVVILI